MRQTIKCPFCEVSFRVHFEKVKVDTVRCPRCNAKIPIKEKPTESAALIEVPAPSEAKKPWWPTIIIIAAIILAVIATFLFIYRGVLFAETGSTAQLQTNGAASRAHPPPAEGAANGLLWPNFNYDNHNSGNTPYPFKNNIADVTKVDLRMLTLTPGTAPASPPIVTAEGEIILGFNGNVVWLDLDGKLLHKEELTQGELPPLVFSDPAGDIFAACPFPDGTVSVYAIDKHTLTKIFTEKGELSRFPMAPDSHSICIGINDSIYKIASDGKLLWQYTFDWNGALTIGNDFQYDEYGYPYALAASDSGTIYAGTYRYLACLGSDGTLKWKTDSGGLTNNTPIVGNDGNIYMFSPMFFVCVSSEGKTLWQKKLLRTGFSAIPAISEDNITYTYGNRIFYKYDARGNVLGSYSAVVFTSSPVLTSDGKVLVAGGDGNLYCFDTEVNLISAQRLLPNDKDITHSVAFIPGAILATTRRGFLYIGHLAEGVPVALRGSLANSPYPKYKIDYGLTGQSAYAGPRNPVLKWKYSTGAPLQFTSPIITQDGKIIVGNDSGTLCAVDRAGYEVWKCSLGASVRTTPLASDTGTIYVNVGKIYAISEEGEILAEYKPQYVDPEAYMQSSPTLDREGNVLMPVRDAFLSFEILILTPALTELRHIPFTAGSFLSSAPTDEANNIYYIYRTELTLPKDHRVVKWSPEGKTLWETLIEYPSSVRYDNTPVLAPDGSLVYLNAGGWLYKFDTEGKILWKYFTGGDLEEGPNVCIFSPCIARDGTIYCVDIARNLFSFSPAGALNWEVKLPGAAWGFPTIDNKGDIYVVTEGGHLLAFSREGKIIFDYTVDESLTGAPVIDVDNTIYVATHEGSLIAITEKERNTLQNYLGKNR